MKKCIVCKKKQSLEEFEIKNYYKHRSSIGSSKTCKKCRNKKHAINRKNIKSEFSARGLYRGINKGRYKKTFTREAFIKWHENLENHNCAYCNTSYEKYFKKKVYRKCPGLKTWLKFTLDRKDSFKPYTLKNICISCPLCNYVKGFIFSAEDFKKIAKQFIIPLYK